MLRAADRLGCPPWELLDGPPCKDVWRELAVGAMAAEAHARDVKRRQHGG